MLITAQLPNRKGEGRGGEAHMYGRSMGIGFSLTKVAGVYPPFRSAGPFRPIGATTIIEGTVL